MVPDSSVLFVCMGNICRSPTAEGVFRALARRDAPDLSLLIDSAGTHGYHVGEPPDPRAVAAARRRGIDLSTLRARQITAKDFTRFDRIVVMDEANFAAVRAIRPCASATRVELFLDYFPAAGAREVPDPYTGDLTAFEHVLDLVEGAARGLLASLNPLRA